MKDLYILRGRESDCDVKLAELLDKYHCFGSLYGALSIDYYRSLKNCAIDKNISIVVVKDEVPICGFKGYHIVLEGGSEELSCFDIPAIYIESIGIDAVTMRSARRNIKKTFEDQMDDLKNLDRISFSDCAHQKILSPISKSLLDRGARLKPKFTQVLDLSNEEEFLHSGLTKSNRWAINWGKKNLRIEIQSRYTVAQGYWDAFRELHLKAAGRATRSRESWQLQYEMVRAGQAFAVMAWSDEVLVSAALFLCSASHCYYGVSAFDRNLDHKPISHCVIWTAAMHAKNMGIRWFELGDQLYAGTQYTAPTKKEMGISYFKKSFGGDTWTAFDIELVNS